MPAEALNAMPAWTEFGLVGLVLIVVYRMLGIMQHMILARKGISNGQTEPRYYEHIKEIHALATRANNEISTGKFNCAWHDREEVRDLKTSMQALTTAMTELTAEMRARRK